MEVAVVGENPPLLNLPLELSIMVSEWLVKRTQHDSLSVHKDKLGDLLSLSLTCKTLAQSCAPTLYKRVVLSDATSTSQFLASVFRRPFLKDHVRILVTADPAPECQRKEVKTSQSLGDSIIDETNETIKVVKFDRVAAKLLWWGTVRLEVLIVIRILQHLPELRQLNTIRTISRVALWPEKHRLIGSFITKLHLSAANDGGGEKDISSWMRAFRPGRGPTALKSFLVDCKDLRPSQFSSPSRPLDGDLREHTTSLQELSFKDVTFDNFPALSGVLKHYPNLVILRISSKTVELSYTLATLLSYPNLTGSLRALEICGPRGVNDTQTLIFLPTFTKLTSLSIPMTIFAHHAAQFVMRPASEVSPPPCVTILPPQLAKLTLSQMDGWRYLDITLRLVEAGYLPTSLRSIMLRWDYAHFKDELIDRKRFEPLFHSVDQFEQECSSKNIALLHFLDMPPSITIHERERHPIFTELNRDTMHTMLEYLRHIESFCTTNAPMDYQLSLPEVDSDEQSLDLDGPDDPDEVKDFSRIIVSDLVDDVLSEEDDEPTFDEPSEGEYNEQALDSHEM